MDKFLEINYSKKKKKDRLNKSKDIKTVIFKTSDKEKSRVTWFHWWILPDI